VERDGLRVRRDGYRLDVPAAALAGELHEMSEQPLRVPLPAGRRPHRDRMHVAHRLGLREKAEQVGGDLPSPADDEGRISELVDEERVVELAGVAPVPEFMQLVEDAVVVLPGADLNLRRSVHRPLQRGASAQRRAAISSACK
jgi:hypothetical protein